MCRPSKKVSGKPLERSDVFRTKIIEQNGPFKRSFCDSSQCDLEQIDLSAIPDNNELQNCLSAAV